MFCPSFDGQEELAVCTDICQDLRTFEFAESNFSKLLHYSVKGRLKASIEFWRFIGAPKFILDIIFDGYKIPFITIPLRLLSILKTMVLLWNIQISLTTLF